MRLFLTNIYYYTCGLILLYLNKIRYKNKPYSPPLPDPANELKVFNNWVKFLKIYSGCENKFKDSNVLEIGLNKNISSAIIAKAAGAKTYDIIDFYPHHGELTHEFLSELNELIQNEYGDISDITLGKIINEVELIKSRLSMKIHYCPMAAVDLSNIKEKSIDLIVSQAAFEHISDIETAIRQMSDIARHGAIFLSEIDLKTHTRWLRDVDPLNIYRYGRFVYEFGRFSVMPNRIRPNQYRNFLEKYGWQNIEVIVLEEMDVDDTSYRNIKFSKQFCSLENNMRQLSVIICATKS